MDDVVAIAHPYGCGVAIDAPGAAIPIRTLRNLALHPNFGGEVMVVSLGCEKLQPVRLMPASALPVLEEEPSVAVLQDAHEGFGEMVANIMALAEKKLTRLNERRRDDVPGFRSCGGPAVRRIGCDVGRDGESGGGLCGGPAGARGRDRDVL